MKKIFVYIMDFMPTKSGVTAAIYYQIEGEKLTVLWPDKIQDFLTKYKGNHDKVAKLWGMSKQSRNGDLPHYYFRFDDYGEENWHQCGLFALRALRTCGLNGEFIVHRLTGVAPQIIDINEG